MNRFRYCTALAGVTLLPLVVDAQSTCHNAHRESGAFICYPNPNEHKGDETVTATFHLSAQANALPGRNIGRYLVLVDDRRVYEAKLSNGMERLSIEINVNSPYSSGSHALRLIVDGAGSAEVAGLTFQPANKLGLCDPFSRVDARNCVLWRTRTALDWTVPSGPHELFRYSDYALLYGRNLTSIEADVADAVAVDNGGNLYTASHSFADLEVRKYGRDGSLLFDDLIRSCGPGFSSIAGVVVDGIGHVWIAGTTTACITTTQNAMVSQVSDARKPHGFVMFIDTRKTAATPPTYATYLASVENRISALRVSPDGTAYVTGTTASGQFPHDSTVNIDPGARIIPGEPSSFSCAMNPQGSALRWSTLLPGAELNALALDGSGDVYVAGQLRSRRSMGFRGDGLVARLSGDGRRAPYVGWFGGSGLQEGGAISLTPEGGWVLVAGEAAESRSRSRADASFPEASQIFAVAFQLCSGEHPKPQNLTDKSITGVPRIAVQPALDAFAMTLRSAGGVRADWKGGYKTPPASAQLSCATVKK